jgi:hypothetical protein
MPVCGGDSDCKSFEFGLRWFESNRPHQMKKSILYLAKDNDALCSHCECEKTLITAPGQADCPWCGCGWLFTCIECRKAFTFARAVEWHGSWEDLARKDLEGFGRIPIDDSISEWVEFMKVFLADIKLHQQYVYFDGAIIPINESHIHLRGLHADHNLDFIPQVAALEDPTIVNDLLTNPDYWQAHHLS